MVAYDDFERLMLMRYVPPMRSNLPQRIIEASLRDNQPKAKSKRVWRWWRLFILPKPAYALAVALFVGVFVGFNMDTVTGLDLNNTYITGYFEAEDQTGLGEWL